MAASHLEESTSPRGNLRERVGKPVLVPGAGRLAVATFAKLSVLRRFSKESHLLITAIALLLCFLVIPAGQASAADCATFNADINYPDGTTVAPGQTINKGWRLNNCGTTYWSGYRAVRVGGTFGPTAFDVPTVAPGTTGDLYANITVPTTSGLHRATYKLEGRNGQFGESFWVEVNVVAPNDCAAFVADLNYPDGSQVSPGQTINKSWRLRNCGDTTWSGYSAVRISGSFGPTSFSVSTTVSPGTTVDLYTDITVPTTSGTHRATYKLEGPRGQFGDSFWVEVNVVASPTNDCAAFVADLNYLDGSQVSPGQTINKGWQLRNCGTTTWSGYTAVRTGGSFGPTSFSVSATVSPGSTVDLYTDITVPTTLGTHRATYKISGPQGTFGDPFWIEVFVTDGSPVGDVALLAPVSRGQTLSVSHGYNDPLPGEPCNIGGGGADHCDNQKYGLDLVPSEQTDLRILAPLPGRIAWISGGCLGMLTRDNLNLNVCHFSSVSAALNDEVGRGAVLGTRSTSWIHLSLDDRYRDSSKPPVAFNGAHTLEGRSVDPGPDDQRNQHLGVTFTSTNGPGQLADLLVDDISFSSPPAVGVQTIATARLRNIGQAASGEFNVKWVVDGNEYAGRHISLNPGDTSSDNVRFLWTNPTQGRHTFRFEADLLNEVPELDENNNRFERVVDVGVVLPLVTAEGTDLSASEKHRDPATITIRRTRDTSGELTVFFNVSNGSSALYGVDYEAFPLFMTLAPGQATATITITPIDDVTPELPETVWFVLQPHPDYELGSSSGAVAIIADDDSQRVSVEVSTTLMTPNEDGWYSQNPLEISVQLSCPLSFPPPPLGEYCQGVLRLRIDQGSGAPPRFFVYDADLLHNDPHLIAPCGEAKEEVSRDSLRAYEMVCLIRLPASVLNPVATKRWRVWVQPSDSARIAVSASWEGFGADSDELTVERALIHPLVFIHGILGSMPPQNLLVTSRDSSRAVLDPFLGGYWPLLDNLLKMGYEWNKTLFGLAYDWRESNRVSGGFLGEQLAALPPRPTYAAADGKADLVVHSMGGLVSRAYIEGFAVSPGTGKRVDYARNVNRVVFIASPHRGFPFDYRTREEGRWNDYLYNAPAAGLQQYALNNIIWPRLVSKKFQPTEDELRAVCSGVGTAEYQIPVIGPVNHYYCRLETIVEWGKHPTRGAESLKEMLPTEDSPAYLLKPSGLPLPFPPTFPFGHEQNDFLQDLNRDIGLLVSELGDPNLPDNVYVIYGEGASETDQDYYVGFPGPFGRYGTVDLGGIGETTLGDDLIPSSSTNLQILLPALPSANVARIDASPPTDARPGRHKEIVLNRDVLTLHLPKFLTGAQGRIPLDTSYPTPGINIGETFNVTTSCPINLMLTDPLGRRLGFDPTDGTVRREIPDSLYTRPNVEPQILMIGEPMPGPYRVTVTGFGEGLYEFTLERTGPSGGVPLTTIRGRTVPDKVEIYNVGVPANSPPAAITDSYEVVGASRTLVVDAPGVLSNDVELDSEPLTAILESDPAYGALTLNADGSFRYTPGPAFPGSDSFTYKASDGQFESHAATVTLSVSRPQVFAGEDQSGAEGTSISFSGYFRDPDASRTHTVEWDFGDGGPAAKTLTPAHTYADDGIYKVVLRVTNSDGGVGSDTLYVTVANLPPLVEAGGDQAGKRRQPLRFAGAFADPGSEDTHTFFWDFGDGATADTLTPVHRYRDAGTYWVTLTVRDDDGGEGSDGLTVTISDELFCEDAFIETFNAYGKKADPVGWVDYEIEGRRFSEEEAFRTGLRDGEIVYVSQEDRSASEYRDEMALGWRNYDWSGRVRLPRGKRGNAFLFYSDIQSGRFYQLKAVGSDHRGYSLLKGWQRSLSGLTESGFVPEARVWYRFRIRVESLAGATAIQARFWREDEPEPIEWMVDALDTDEPLDSGTIGVVAFAEGSLFDEFRVEALSDESGISGDRDGDDICDGEDNCPALANSEQDDADKDGAGNACDACTAAFMGGESCLDSGYDPTTGLSSRVVALDGGTEHVSGDGECGAKGFYRLPEGGGLVFQTPSLPEEGRYWFRFKLRTGEGDAPFPLRMEIEGHSYNVRFDSDEQPEAWRDSEAVRVALAPGVHLVRLVANEGSVDVEEAELEEVCAEESLSPPHGGEQGLEACLDR